MHFHIPQLVQRLLPTVAPGSSISPAEWKVLEKAAEILIEGSPLETDGKTIADNCEVFFNAGKSQRLWRIRLLFVLVELLPLTVYGKRFTQLTKEQRRHLAEEYLASDRRFWRLAGKIRILVYLGAYGDADTSQATGFVPIPLRRRFRKDAGAQAPSKSGDAVNPPSQPPLRAVL